MHAWTQRIYSKRASGGGTDPPKRTTHMGTSVAPNAGVPAPIADSDCWAQLGMVTAISES